MRSKRVARHRVPLFPEPQRAGHRGRRRVARAGAHASSRRRPTARERVHELFAETFPRFKEFEPQMRAAAQLTLEQWALERAGLLEEEPYRRGHRVRILAHAIEPLAPELPPAVRDRLHRALSVVYGIEPYIVLKDIWGLADREVERIALWMADALIDAALHSRVGRLRRRRQRASDAAPAPREPDHPPQVRYSSTMSYCSCDPSRFRSAARSACR